MTSAFFNLYANSYGNYCLKTTNTLNSMKKCTENFANSLSSVNILENL